MPWRFVGFCWESGVLAMEYESIDVKVPKGFVREGWQLVIGEKAEGDCLVKSMGQTMYGEDLWLLLRPAEKKLRKPSDWEPPSSEWKWGSGWITWGEREGWMWWTVKPTNFRYEGWMNEDGRHRSGGNIAKDVMKSMGFPDCAGLGFNEWECIWKIGVELGDF